MCFVIRHGYGQRAIHGGHGGGRGTVHRGNPAGHDGFTGVGVADAEAPDEAGHDVSKKFEVDENDPRSQCSGPLILVSSGDPYAIRVAEARALLRGGTVEMRLASHPGLEFLESTPEFQERYALTVVARIFHCVNRAENGKIALHELRRNKPNLYDACKAVDREEDINAVNQYFSCVDGPRTRTGAPSSSPSRRSRGLGPA